MTSCDILSSNSLRAIASFLGDKFDLICITRGIPSHYNTACQFFFFISEEEVQHPLYFFIMLLLCQNTLLHTNESFVLLHTNYYAMNCASC